MEDFILCLKWKKSKILSMTDDSRTCLNPEGGICENHAVLII